MTPEDRVLLEKEIAAYNPPDAVAGSGEDAANISYKPVWLDDNVATGHYEGYCKTSECSVHVT